MLDSFQIKKQLMIAEAFVAYSGGKVIEKKQKGLASDKEFLKLKPLLCLIDSLRNYATIYKNPSIGTGVFLITAPGNTVTFTFNKSIVIGPITLPSMDLRVAEQTIVDFINNANAGFTATLSDNCEFPIIISAVNGSTFNGIDFSYTSIGPVILTTSLPASFSTDGDDFFNKYPSRCLKDNEVRMILDRLSRYRNIDCSNFVNF